MRCDCKNCLHQYTLPDNAVGKRARCKACGTVFVVEPISQTAPTKEELTDLFKDVVPSIQKHDTTQPLKSYGQRDTSGAINVLPEHQIHKCCPKCGSKRFKLAASSRPIAQKGLASMIPIRDRLCKKCGTQYSPTMPKIIPYVFIILGITLACLGVMAFFEPLMKGGSVQFRGWVKFAIILGGVFCFVAGIQMFRKKKP